MRDVALRRTRRLVAAMVAAAVGLSAATSAVAAHAFKGHSTATATTTTGPAAPRTVTRHAHVARPDRIPSIAGEHASPKRPAQPPAASAPAPPAQPPAAAAPAPPAPAPAPQVSGGS